MYLQKKDRAVNMRYEIQWFPKGKSKYNIKKLYKAVNDQTDVKDVAISTPSNRYRPWKSPESLEAVQFTVNGDYPYEIVADINDKLMKATNCPDPQGLSVRAISDIDRKKIISPIKQKRCGCKNK